MTRLKRMRVDKGLTQSELANESGVNLRMIQHYEQGFKDINKAQVITVFKIASVLGCKVEDLIEAE